MYLYHAKKNVLINEGILKKMIVNFQTQSITKANIQLSAQLADEPLHSNVSQVRGVQCALCV
jgi:hypothetical protein